MLLAAVGCESLPDAKEASIHVWPCAIQEIENVYVCSMVCVNVCVHACTFARTCTYIGVYIHMRQNLAVTVLPHEFTKVFWFYLNLVSFCALGIPFLPQHRMILRCIQQSFLKHILLMQKSASHSSGNVSDAGQGSCTGFLCLCLQCTK